MDAPARLMSSYSWRQAEGEIVVHALQNISRGQVRNKFCRSLVDIFIHISHT